MGGGVGWGVEGRWGQVWYGVWSGVGGGKGNSNSHGARPVHRIITKTKWIQPSRLSIKNSLSEFASRVMAFGFAFRVAEFEIAFKVVELADQGFGVWSLVWNYGIGG